MTEETIQKLEKVFAYGASDREACLYAGIAPSTLYAYCAGNKEFSERKELLKERPVLQARETVVKAIQQDSHLAFKYLERKVKNEFSSRNEITGADGEAIEVDLISEGKKRSKKWKESEVDIQRVDGGTDETED